MTTAKNEGGWINLWMGGMSIFSAGRWLPPSPQQGKPWPNQMSLHWKMKAPFWKMIPWKPNFWKLLSIYVFHFLMLHLAAPWPTLGHYQEKCLTHQVWTTSFLSIFKGYCEPCNEPLLVNQAMLSPCIHSSPTSTKFLRAPFGRATP